MYQLDLTKANFIESISKHFYQLYMRLLFLMSSKIMFYYMKDQKSPQAINILDFIR